MAFVEQDGVDLRRMLPMPKDCDHSAVKIEDQARPMFGQVDEIPQHVDRSSGVSPAKSVPRILQILQTFPGSTPGANHSAQRHRYRWRAPHGPTEPSQQNIPVAGPSPRTKKRECPRQNGKTKPSFSDVFFDAQPGRLPYRLQLSFFELLEAFHGQVKIHSGGIRGHKYLSRVK